MMTRHAHQGWTPKAKTLAGVFLVASLLTAVRAQAWYEQTKASLLDVHRALFERVAADHAGGAHTITLNGAHFVTQSGSTHQTMEQVLAGVESLCRRDPSPGGFSIPHALSERSRDEAFLVCFRPTDELNRAGLAAAHQRLLASGSLTSLGKLVGVYVRRTDHGSAFLAWQPAGELPIAQMFPASGDAPGADIPGLPRPSGRRTLSAGIDGKPLLAAYAATTRQLESMGTRLGQRGFRVAQQKHEAGPRKGEPKSSLLAQNETRSVLLVTTQSEGEHLLVVAELP